MKRSLALSVIVVFCVVAVVVGKLVFAHWFDLPDEMTFCINGSNLYESSDVASRPLFHACLEAQAKLFLERDYLESKDLAKTFLTLLSAVLVASITFSEKIVDVSKAELLPLASMILCWMLLLVAIVACGAGLAFMTTAAGLATYDPARDYRQIEARGITLFFAASGTFIFALIALIVAGVASLVEKRTASLASTEPNTAAPLNVTSRQNSRGWILATRGGSDGRRSCSSGLRPSRRRVV